MRLEEFRHILATSEDESDLRDLVEIDPDNSTAFSPKFRLREGALEEEGEAEIEAHSAQLLNLANSFCRRVRNRRYRRRIKDGYAGIRIVSEGDSWFQYPFLLADVIDQLSKPYAIYSLGAGGDWLRDITEQDEFMQAIRAEEPDFFLVSGGGNDLVGNLPDVLRPYDAGLKPEEYLNDKFQVFLDAIAGMYIKLFDQVRGEFPGVRILCHGYNYAIPNGQKWLGQPMEENLKIEDKHLQEAILRVIMNRFNETMIALTLPLVGVHFIDCRDSFTRDEWYDELHPVDRGFEKVAMRFKSVLEN